MSVHIDPQALVTATEEAVQACLPILPLEGSDRRGYTVSPRIQTVVAGTPEEWASAAVAIGNLHALLNGLVSTEERLDASGGAFEVEDDEDGMRTGPEDPIAWWVPVAIGMGLAIVIIVAGIKL